MSSAAISARAARWCSQKRDHLTFFFTKGLGGNRENRKRGVEMKGEERRPSFALTLEFYFVS